MTDRVKTTPVCANEGCGKPVEDGSRFCAACGLDWMLLRRDTRRQANVIGGPRSLPEPPRGSRQ